MVIIDNDYSIETDSLNFTLYCNTHKQNKKGKDIIRTIGYYGTLQSAFRGMLKDMQRREIANGVFDIEQAIEKLEELNKYIESKILMLKERK